MGSIEKEKDNLNKRHQNKEISYNILIYEESYSKSLSNTIDYKNDEISKKDENDNEILLSKINGNLYNNLNKLINNYKINIDYSDYSFC